MNALVVDTSSWIKYFSGSPIEVLDRALEEGRVYLPPLVAAELTSGRLNKRDRNKLEDMLNELPLVETPLEHWLRVGKLRSDLLFSGFQISTPDAHIAQCCLDLKGYLLSEDKIFSKISRKLKLRLAS